MGGIGRVAPEFAGFEPDCVEPLWTLAGTVRVGVRKDEATMQALDDALLGAGVARQPGVARRMEVTGPDPVAHGEAGCLGDWPVVRAAGGQHLGDVSRAQDVGHRLARVERPTLREFLSGDQTGVDEYGLQSPCPDLVV